MLDWLTEGVKIYRSLFVTVSTNLFGVARQLTQTQPIHGCGSLGRMDLDNLTGLVIDMDLQVLLLHGGYNLLKYTLLDAKHLTHCGVAEYIISVLIVVYLIHSNDIHDFVYLK